MGEGLGMRAILTTLIIFFSSLIAASTPSGIDILKQIEHNTRMTTDITATVSLTQQKTGQGIKDINMLFYRRDSDNSFLIVMTGPESDKGNGYLRVGDNFWMYRRNTRSFQHINRDENIAGTEALGGCPTGTATSCAIVSGTRIRFRPSP